MYFNVHDDITYSFERSKYIRCIDIAFADAYHELLNGYLSIPNLPRFKAHFKKANEAAFLMYLERELYNEKQDEIYAERERVREIEKKEQDEWEQEKASKYRRYSEDRGFNIRPLEKIEREVGYVAKIYSGKKPKRERKNKRTAEISKAVTRKLRESNIRFRKEK